MEIAVAIITIIPTLATLIISTITNKKVKKQDDIKKDIKQIQNNIKEEINQLQLDNCKNYLVQAIAKVESGQDLSPVEKERYFENYDTYVKLGGNSYIHSETERLKERGRL